MALNNKYEFLNSLLFLAWKATFVSVKSICLGMRKNGG
jgi:hypothetical protein